MHDRRQLLHFEALRVVSTDFLDIGDNVVQVVSGEINDQIFAGHALNSFDPLAIPVFPQSAAEIVNSKAHFALRQRRRALGLDVLPLQPAGLAVRRTLTVVGFFQTAVGLGHDFARCFNRSEMVKYETS
jgi:hypothetical protein